MNAQLTIRNIPRERDDEVLDAIQQKRNGATWAQIAARMGVFPNAAQQALRNVLVADIEESGEPEEAVRAAYWQ